MLPCICFFELPERCLEIAPSTEVYPGFHSDPRREMRFEICCFSIVLKEHIKEERFSLLIKYLYETCWGIVWFVVSSISGAIMLD